MLTIGTRGSELALWQARHIQARLGGEAAGVQLKIVKTSGDQLLNIPLQAQLDKGFFTKELEVELANNLVDAAVHSLKDLPTNLPPGLVLAAIPERAEVNDVLLVHRSALDLSRPLPVKAGARIGTASMRRSALLLHVAPDVEAVLLRGNVPTRLNKAKTGELDAVLLARAGLARLNLDPGDLAVFDLNPQRWLPAAAQGALGIEIREDDKNATDYLKTLHDQATATAVGLERGLLRRIEGGCHSPFGALATVRTDGTATLRAGTVGTDGIWRAIEVEGPIDTLVERAFALLMAQGPDLADDSPWYTPARSWH